MNCLEFRQLTLSEPNNNELAAIKHRDECDACTQFSEQLSSLDVRLHQALSLAVPEGLAARILLNHSLQKPKRKPTRWLWLSMAASFFAVIGISYQFYQHTFQQTIQQTSIASPLLAHINHQPHEFYGAAHIPITNEKLKTVLASFNAEADIENVVYAAVCPIDGEEAAHLVIKDGKDQYTVMLIPEYSPGKTYSVDDGIWRGYISPHPAGALAILADSGHSHAVSRLKAISKKYQGAFYLTQR